MKFRVLLLMLGLMLLFSTATAQAQQDTSTAQAQQDTSTEEVVVVEAVTGVLTAFDSYPVVAIGEQHGIAELGEFYLALIRHPEFAQKVDALVMEYGNALYQDLIDRYVNGEDVPHSELVRVWSDAVGKIPGGTEIMYAQVFAAVREINTALPENERIRVLLGDSPIDWSVVDSRDDILPFQAQRETHFAEVVITQVLDQGLKALVITGAPHLDRSTPSMPAPSPDRPSSAPLNTAPMLMQQIVETRYPGQTFVIVVHTGFVEDDCNAEVEARMAGWQTPALATVAGTWIEAIDCQKFPAAIMIQVDPSGNPLPGNSAPGNTMQQVPMEPGAAPQGNTMIQPPAGGPPAGVPPQTESMIAQADAYLYLGNRDALTMSPFDPIIYLDSAFFAEQSRRHELLFGAPLDCARMLRGNPRFYVDNFPG